MLDAKNQKCLARGPCSPRVSYLIQKTLQGNEATVGCHGCFNQYVHARDLGLQRSNGWSKSLSHREGSMEEADIEPGVGQ